MSIQSRAIAIKKVGVVGLGLMGHGIAQVVAQQGYEVLAIETKEEYLSKGISRIEGSLSKVIAKDLKSGVYKNEMESKLKYEEIMSRISKSTKTSDAKDCDLIIEAIAEIEDLKIKFYQDLAPQIKSEAIFASNTSSLPITAMAVASGRPKQFVGLHFFNPVQVMKLVEVVRTIHTDDETFQAMLNFTASIGKSPVKCNDTPGFIVNRLLVPYLAQAMSMIDRNDASVEDIDLSMQLGARHPMGPLQLADYIGLDTAFNILVGWKASYPNEAAFMIPKCLPDKVAKGDFGRKSGKGFYHWEGDQMKGPVRD